MSSWTEKDYADHMAKFETPMPKSAVQQVAELTAPAKRQKQPSQAIVFQCKVLGLPVPVAEFRFHETRRWLFDWAWPDRKIALEQEGVVYQKAEGQQHMLGGRHVSVTGFKKDLEKYGTAFSMGWRVLRCLPEQIEDGQAVQWLEPMLKG